VTSYKIEVSQTGSSSTCLTTESLVVHGDAGEMIQFGKDEVNIARDPGLWLDFFADGVADILDCSLIQ